MSTTEDDNQQPWTTWEELLLAFAVKRHGCRNWDSVATELHTRTKVLTSPDACRLKFQDLRRRFAAQEAEDDDLSVPWVEDLRRLRLEELRDEVNRHDHSISSLQLKVKRLEQDREQSFKEEDAEKPSDLDKSNRRDAEPADRHADDDQESDPENQSVNGSNSTGPNKAKDRSPGQNELDTTQPGLDEKTEPVQPGSKQNESSSTSSDESSDSIAKGLPIEAKNAAESGEGGTKTDSDVQSSATLSRKRRREKEASGASAEADGCVTTKSEPLINVLGLVRAHRDASFFDCRLQIQDTKLYNNVVRQHMDLQTIQNNLDSGSYASSHLHFFRDLLLLFTNSIIFYPKSSPEFKAAQELRSIISDKIDEQYKQLERSEEKLSSASPSPGAKPPALERSDSLLAKNKPSGGPIVVCRKRSSISGKGNSTSKGEQQSDIGVEMKTVALADLKPSSPKEERSLLNSKTKDRIVTGTRSLRRSNTSSLKNPATLPNAIAAATTSISNKKEIATTTGGAAAAATTTTTTEKKKDESSASKKDDNSAKKRGAADFLKRLKGNSPVKSKDVKSSATKGNSSTAGGEQKKKNGNGDKVDGRRKITTRQSDLGKPSSKTEGAATSPTKRNVGRPSKKTPEPAAAKRARDAEASASVVAKQPKKRTRR